jgi:hypothetical protein
MAVGQYRVFFQVLASYIAGNLKKEAVMARVMVLLVTVFLAAVCFMLPAQADVTRQGRHKEKQCERVKKADTNCDGVLSSAEKVKARSRTNTTAEQKYDANGDGWLDATEGKEYLKDKYTVIKTDGKAKVDTQLETQYDTNKDGVIDAGEAAALKKELED